MKVRPALLLLLAITLCVACKGNPAAPDRLPSWLTSLIHRLESQPVANPPAYVARYSYRGEVVYYVPPRCCDESSTLYRVDGGVICHPDGGLTGAGDGRCPTFMSERTNEVIVWRDARQVKVGPTRRAMRRFGPRA